MFDCVTVFIGLLLVQFVYTNPDCRRETGSRGIGCIGAHKRAAATALYVYPCSWFILSHLMWTMYSVAMMLSCLLHDFGCFHIGNVFILHIIILTRHKKPPNKRFRPLSYIKKRYNMQRLLNCHGKSIRLHIKTQNSTINIDGVKAPPPHHGGDSAIVQ